MEHSYNQPSDIFPEQPLTVYAGFWQRLAASILDGLIVGVPVGILGYIIEDRSEPATGLFEIYASPGNLLNIVAAWLYASLLESSPAQATIGKKALGIKVTDTNGQRISFGRATGRHFGKIISTIILLIGYFMMLWDDRNQTLHDKMADTLIVKR